MRLAAIDLHPVKSTAIVPVSQARVERTGLTGDREWMVVDAGGDLLSARNAHAMFEIDTEPLTDADGRSSGVVLRAPGRPPLEVTRPDGEPRPVTMFGRDLRGVAASAEADRWLDEALGRTGLRLVWYPLAARTETVFHDDFAISLVTDASMGQLDVWLRDTAADVGEPDPGPLPFRRFRPNLFVEGCAEAGVAAFAEDGWQRLRIGDVDLVGQGPIARCVMTTIDADTLEAGKEPVRTLARHRRWEGATWMCAGFRLDSADADAVGTIRVGDPVEVLG